MLLPFCCDLRMTEGQDPALCRRALLLLPLLMVMTEAVLHPSLHRVPLLTALLLFLLLPLLLLLDLLPALALAVQLLLAALLQFAYHRWQLPAAANDSTMPCHNVVRHCSRPRLAQALS